MLKRITREQYLKMNSKIDPLITRGEVDFIDNILRAKCQLGIMGHSTFDSIAYTMSVDKIARMYLYFMRKINHYYRQCNIYKLEDDYWLLKIKEFTGYDDEYWVLESIGDLNGFKWI